MKTFQQLLEKRVRKHSQINSDKYVIQKAAQMVVFEMFGKVGEANMEIVSQEEVLKINCFHSIWRAELEFQKNQIIQQINQKLGTQAVKRIKITQWNSRRN